MKRDYPTYLRTLLTAIAAALVALLLFNLLIDPFDAHRLLDDWPMRRHEAGLGARIAKAEAIAHRDWDVLLLGNSRMEIGLNPRHPALAGQRVYNDGLFGADMNELDAVARMAIRRPGLKRIILGLDLFSFDPQCPPVPDVRQTLLNPNLNRIDYELANLLSINVTTESCYSIDNAVRHRPGDHWPLGQLTDLDKYQTHGRQDWVTGGYYSLTIPRASRKLGWQLSDTRFAALEKLLDDAGRQGVRVDVVQLPMHVMCLERFAAEGRWAVYEQWLAELSSAVAAHNRRFPDHAVPLWDFCTYNAYNTEPYPQPSETSTRMRWYLDPFHFKTELGDLVLDRILDYPPPANTDLSNFGVLLGEDIGPHLADLRHDHEAYVASHPDIQRIAQAIRAWRASPHPDDD